MTIDIRVKTITDPRANARLREYIIGEGAIMGCQHGRGPGCSAVTELEKPVTVPCDAALVGGSAIAAPSMRSGSFTRADGAAADGARVDVTPQRPGAPAC